MKQEHGNVKNVKDQALALPRQVRVALNAHDLSNNIYIYIYIYIVNYTYIQLCITIYIYIYMYVHVYTYTHTHIICIIYYQAG